MKCLFVEDDINLRFRIASAMEEAGIAVTASDTIAGASAALRRQRFDVAVLDYYLPDGTSEDLANYIYITQPQCRVIMVTAGDRYHFGEYAKASPGIDWILHKPVDISDLCALTSYAGHMARTEVERQANAV